MHQQLGGFLINEYRSSLSTLCLAIDGALICRFVSRNRLEARKTRAPIHGCDLEPGFAWRDTPEFCGSFGPETGFEELQASSALDGGASDKPAFWSWNSFRSARQPRGIVGKWSSGTLSKCFLIRVGQEGFGQPRPIPLEQYAQHPLVQIDKVVFAEFLHRIGQIIQVIWY
jgi:hypothetical protein